MPTASTLITFTLIVFVFAAIPGPSNLYVVAQGIQSGRRPALAAAGGNALGAFGYAAATTVGLAALLASSARALQFLHYLGGAYLLFLGVRAWRNAARPGRAPAVAARSAARSLRRGVLVELSNPKVGLFFLAFLPQFVHRGQGPAWSQLLVLGIVFCVTGLISDALYAVGAGTLGQRMHGSRRLLSRSERGSAVAYLALGGWAIWSGTQARAR